VYNFPLYDYLFKIGIILVVISFVVGFFGNQYEGVAFSLHYYQYLYLIVIMAAGIRYGVLGGILSAATLSALHITSLNFNETYYHYQNMPVHYNFQIILFTATGLITGYGYELMSKKLTAVETSYRASLRQKGTKKTEKKDDNAEEVGLKQMKSDVNIKNLNVLFKFTRNILSLTNSESLFESFMSILALDYNTREVIVFKKEDRILQAILAKGYSGKDSISDIQIPVGEKLPGKAVASGQFLNLDPPDPDADWMMAIPVFTGRTCTHCIAIAKWKSMRRMDPEEIQNMMRMATILGEYLELLVKIGKKRTS
jgi:hypothetical protein